jgi:hypothetical protein
MKKVVVVVNKSKNEKNMKARKALVAGGGIPIGILMFGW